MWENRVHAAEGENKVAVRRSDTGEKARTTRIG
jgi:hypothetical protein